MAEWLARVSGGDRVDRLDLGPVDARHVAEVRDLGVMRRQHLAGRWLNLRVPGEAPAVEGEHCHVQAAVPGEQRADAGGHDTPPRILGNRLDTVSTEAYSVSTGKNDNWRTP